MQDMALVMGIAPESILTSITSDQPNSPQQLGELSSDNTSSTPNLPAFVGSTGAAAIKSFFLLILRRVPPLRHSTMLSAW